MFDSVVSGQVVVFSENLSTFRTRVCGGGGKTTCYSYVML